MAVPAVTTSAAGSLALLNDQDKDIQTYALKHLLTIVPQFWAEISDQIAQLETLANDNDPERGSHAALLVSKVYFYIGYYDEAVTFALLAGLLFEDEPAGEYKETIIAGCLDRAISMTNRGKKVEGGLHVIVDGVMRSSTGDNGKLAMGLALSLRRLDLIEMIFLTSRAPQQGTSKQTRPVHDEGLLRYVLNEVISGASGSDTITPEFRQDFFKLLLSLFHLNTTPDWQSITTIWVQSGEDGKCADQLVKLIKDEPIEAYQIAFDVTEMAPQAFVQGVRTRLGEAGAGAEEGASDSVDASPQTILSEILTGERSAEYFLNFLSKANKTDMDILKSTKDVLEDRYSLYHSAITFTNAFANCGTTSDRFIRENLDWLGRASNWAKFSATASLGLIHRGSWVNGRKVVKPYLPGGSAPNKFSEGGALFALGLIYAGRKEKAEAELRKGIQETNDPVVQHGAALGLGVSALATADEDIYEELKAALFQDNATAGEASGYAMGLVMLGTASDKAYDEMLSYARETQHEKIIRSLAVGIAFLYYGQRERAEPVIKQLADEKDAILRYGGMFTIALAYAGTGNNQAIRRLLHVAVSDVNDDVRRAAVMALGFVLFRNYTQVPRIVQLLAESYNPHVRYGATLALGISCAGTGLDTAIELLEPMTRDPVDFVRQGALISLSMVLIQQNAASSSKVASVRELLAKTVADKHEDPMARFGGALAQGIIDAGGRSMTLSLSTRAGTLDVGAVVGMTLFVQFWYWFPLAHGLGLAFKPTVLIGVDEQLRVPEVQIKTNGKESVFGYPAKTEGKKEEEKKTAAKAVLSTTARAKARERKKKEEDGDVDMDQDAAPTTDASAPTKKKPSAPAEPSSFTSLNMSRVTPAQAPLLSFDSDRYVPLRPIGDAATVAAATASSAGKDKDPASGSAAPAKKGAAAPQGVRLAGGSIVLLRNIKPEEEAKFIELDKSLWPADVPPTPPAEQAPVQGAGEGEMGEEDEAEMPPSFEYPFED